MGNVEVAWEDVISVINMVRTHLIIIAIAFIAMIAVMIIVRKKEKLIKRMIRFQSFFAFLLITVVTLNVAAAETLYNTLNVVLSDKGTLDQGHIDNSKKVIEDVTNEGVVMTKNDNSFLPIAPQKINVFGWSSTNPVYGGTGSGTVDATTAVGILKGLENAGFETNSELSDMYTEYRQDRPVISINDGQDWTLPEVPAADYSDKIINDAKDFSDVAMIVLSRTGGEGTDLPIDMGPIMDGSTMDIGTKYTKGTYTNNSKDYDDFEDGQSYLELSKTEQDLVDLVCSNFDDVIVVYNGANAMELGWTNDYEQIKSVLLCAGAGATGFNALGNIISGEVNPSGKTTDTWLKDINKAPYINNIGHFAYTNTDKVSDAAKKAWERADGIVSFVDYVEGIYVGYRFYETAADEGLINYDDTVMYPFGYGLSYTTFDETMGELRASDDGISVDVTVTNTGDTAGKDVVELYYDPPYYNGGIEKSSVNLLAFDKTDLLEPGESETVTLTFSDEDMASYDTYGAGHYVLEHGDYDISLRTDSHNVVDSKTYNVAEDIVYDENNKHNGDVEVADNKFDFVEGDITYLSRKDGFANYDTATAAPTNFELDGTIYGNGAYDPTDYDNDDDKMPTTGADNGLELFDLRGASYDDDRWEDLLDEMTVDEMVDLIAFGGHQNIAVRSIDKIRILDTDGPAGVNSSTLGIFGTGFCSEIILAQTWNTELAVAFSEAMGQEFADYHVTGWYAPSMNIHRSAFGGRDFEYYSEDSKLSAEMAKAEVEGIVNAGMYPFIKHFVLNEQEINRNAFLTTWSNEQAMREIYFKPFEDTIKAYPDGKIAVMSSYNFLGTEWAGSCTQLLNDVLRGEWGYKGMVISDYFGNYGYMDADRAVRGGTDMMLGTAGNDAIMTDLSATSVIAMRKAVKNILYTTVNSSAYENYVPGETPGWLKMIYAADAIMAVLLIAAEAALIIRYRKKRNNDQIIVTDGE